MPLENLLKLLSAAKFPIAFGLFGLVLNFGGSNLLIKNTGASVGLLATGCAVATATRRNGSLREVDRLTSAHHARESALKASISSALADVAKAQQEAQQQAAIAERSKGAIAQISSQLNAAKTERDQVKADCEKLSNQINAAAASLNTCHSDNSLIAGQLETLEIERMQLIYELYETAVTEADLGSAIASLENQFSNDSCLPASQKKKLKSAVTQARADFHTQITDAQSRIAELENALAEKSKLAEGMIAELDSVNGGQLNHFSGKASAQTEIINGLKTQIDELRKTNTALTLRRFDDVGTDNIMGNRLIDALAKHGSIYGAWHHEREGHNGRLKVWLTMIDAPLSRAKEALEDLEAQLKLWAKPEVKVDKRYAPIHASYGARA